MRPYSLQFLRADDFRQMKGADDTMTEKIRMVIVEDQLLLRETLELAMNSDREFHVAGSFGNAEDALEFIAGNEVDLVMLDRILPGMGGISLTKRIRELQPSSRIVMVSMISDEESVSRAMEAGVDGYLPKEIALAELIRGIKKVYLGEKLICYQLAEKLIKLYS